MPASARTASLLVLAVVLAGCAAAPPPPAPSSPSAAPTASVSVASETAATTSPPPTPSPLPTARPTPQIGAALATLRDPNLAIIFDLSGSLQQDGASLTSSGSLVVAGNDIELVLVTDQLGLRMSEVAKGGQVWLRVNDDRWFLDSDPPSLPTLASAFPSAVALESSGGVYRGSTKLTRVHVTGVDLDRFLAATGMADPGTTNAKGEAYLLLGTDGALAGVEIDATFTGTKGVAPQSIVRTLLVKQVGKVGESGAPKVTAPTDAWIRRYSQQLGYLIVYPPTMTWTNSGNYDQYAGPKTQCIVLGVTVTSKDTLSTLTKAEVERLKKAGATVVSNRSVTVEATPARRLEIKYKAGGKQFWAVKYIVVRGGIVAYSLTWTGLASDRAATEKVAGEMLATFVSM